MRPIIYQSYRVNEKPGFAATFRQHYPLYLQEALGLGIFMISTCFFSVLLESPKSDVHHLIPYPTLRNLIMAILMGLTALFIFYSPFTSASGSHINPAVTLGFYRMQKITAPDTFFYILFQIAGGTLGVWLMYGMLGHALSDPPIKTAVTLPVNNNVIAGSVTEFLISFVTMTMVLVTSGSKRFKPWTRIFSAILVFCWVMIAGPISGFGMNPARSLASAIVADEWTLIWIYLFVPVAGMYAAAECYRQFFKYNEPVKS